MAAQAIADGLSDAQRTDRSVTDEQQGLLGRYVRDDSAVAVEGTLLSLLQTKAAKQPQPPPPQQQRVCLLLSHSFFISRVSVCLSVRSCCSMSKF